MNTVKMTIENCPDFLVQTEDGTIHAYFDPAILRIHLKENSGDRVRVFSRHHGAMTIKYTEVRCLECFDYDDKCQECCQHDEHDHGHCLGCGKDCTDDLVGAAEAYFEGDR
jgi:hypothetical protein